MKLPDEAVRARQRAGQGPPDCCKAETDQAPSAWFDSPQVKSQDKWRQI